MKANCSPAQPRSVPTQPTNKKSSVMPYGTSNTMTDCDNWINFMYEIRASNFQNSEWPLIYFPFKSLIFSRINKQWVSFGFDIQRVNSMIKYILIATVYL